MKVCELVNLLQNLPQDYLVVVDGYESGYDILRQPKVIEIVIRPRPTRYDGHYVDSDEAEWYEEAGEPTPAVYLQRKSW